MGRGGESTSEIAIGVDLVAYHTAPNHARGSLLKHGIDPSRSRHGRWIDGQQGFYCFTDLDEARWYAELQALTAPVEPFDLWKLRLDPEVLVHHDDSLTPGEPQETSSLYVERALKAKRVLLIGSYWPGLGWR